MAALNEQLPDVLEQIGRDIKGIVQDTGWRKMTNEKLADGFVVLRRIGNMVFVNIRGGSWDTFRLRNIDTDKKPNNPEGWRLQLFQLPIGFRPDAPQGASLYQDFYKEIGVCMITSIKDGGAWLEFRSKIIPAKTDNTNLRIQELKFLTSESFPRFLPGVGV